MPDVSLFVFVKAMVFPQCILICYIEQIENHASSPLTVSVFVKAVVFVSMELCELV